MLPGQFKDDLHSQYFPSNLLYKKTTQLYWFAMPEKNCISLKICSSPSCWRHGTHLKYFQTSFHVIIRWQKSSDFLKSITVTKTARTRLVCKMLDSQAFCLIHAKDWGRHWSLRSNNCTCPEMTLPAASKSKTCACDFLH